MRFASSPRILGVPIQLHWSLALVFALILWEAVLRHGGLITILITTLEFVLYALCLIAHELGHCLIARRLGDQPERVTVCPIGAWAVIATESLHPLPDFAIALAGPLVNLLLALLSGGMLFAIWPNWRTVVDPSPHGLASPNAPTLFLLFAFVNLAIALFNLLPCWPLDGGRALRAIFAVAMGYQRATAVLVGISSLVAAAIAYLGIATRDPLCVLSAVVLLGLALWDVRFRLHCATELDRQSGNGAVPQESSRDTVPARPVAL